MRTRLSGRSKPTLRITGVAIFAFAALLMLTRALLPDLFITVTAPAFALGDALSVRTGAFFASFGNARVLAQMNKELSEENAVLALENQTLTEKVKDLSAFFATTSAPESGIVASVLMRPPTAPYDTLVLAAGSVEGAVPTMEAYGAGGVPLGIVGSVTASSARLTLFSSPGVLTDAWVGEGRVPTLLHGAGAGAFTANVSQASGVAVGDLVYLAGPGAVPVGRVAHISGAPSDPVATLAIKPFLNLFSIAWVLLRQGPGSASTTIRGDSGQAQSAVP